MATATANEPRPALSEGALEAVHAFSEGAHRIGAGEIPVFFDPAGGSTIVDVTPVSTAVPTEIEPNPELKPIAVDNNVKEMEDFLSDLASDVDQLDLLRLLDRATRSSETGQIVAISSGLQTVGPVDLLELGWNFNPESIAAQLQQDGKLPDLSGHQVTFVGLGYTAGDQDPPSIRSTRQLERLWLAICQAAGAESCEAQGPAAVSPPGPDAGEVPIVPVSSDETPCVEPQSLPGDVLFFGGTDEFRNDPTAFLTPLANEIAACPEGILVNLTGHTAYVIGDAGTPDDIELSEDRARAVYLKLLALGVPATSFGTITGVGSAYPLVDNYPGGVFDGDLAALNRRVEITFTPRVT